MNNLENPFLSFEKPNESRIPFGREDIVREIFSSLNKIQGAECFSLVGAKYLGKSQILRALMKPSVQNQFLPPRIMEEMAIIHFDCEELPSTRGETFKQIGLKVMKTALQKWGLDFKDGLVSEYKFKLHNSSDFFEISSAFEGLLSFLSRRHKKSIIFVMDNFQYLLELLNETDIQFLRDVFEKSPHALVTSTSKFIREHTPKTVSSKFYEIFKNFRLSPFTTDQAFDFLHEVSSFGGRRFSHSEMNTILLKCGTHPYFLRIYAAETWRQKNKQNTNRPFSNFNLVDRFAKPELNVCFLSLWESIDKKLKTTLFQFAESQILEDGYVGALQKLEDNHGVVFRNSEGNFEITGELFKDFVRSQTELIDILFKTDYYRAGLRAMKQLQNGGVGKTDPQYFFQKAFQSFTSPIPDYDTTNSLIHKAAESLLEIIVKRAEMHLQRPFKGSTKSDMFDFLSGAIKTEKKMLDIFSFLWYEDNQNSVSGNLNFYDTQLRLYILSGITQHLINIKLDKSNDREQISDNYKMVEFVNRTSHSQVVKAWHIPLERIVAIKLLSLDSNFNSIIANRLRENLIREAKIIASLKHPNIGQIYDILKDPFGIVIEWIEGYSLQEVLDKQELLDTVEIVDIAIKLASALSYAHSNKIIHRDVKPSNIVISENGTPVLIDFDIARAANQDTISLDDDGGYFHVGTVKYSAPEQFNEPQKIGPPTDIFSLGIVMYELLTLELPYKFGNSPVHYENGLPKLPIKNIPEKLYEILCAMLNEDPVVRLTTTETMKKLYAFKQHFGVSV